MKIVELEGASEAQKDYDLSGLQLLVTRPELATGLLMLRPIGFHTVIHKLPIISRSVVKRSTITKKIICTCASEIYTDISTALFMIVKIRNNLNILLKEKRSNGARSSDPIPYEACPEGIQPYSRDVY